MLKHRKQITYLISSHVKYYAHTVNMLLDSLLPQVSNNEVVLVIGGCSQTTTQFPVRTELVMHNSFDYTALVWLVESGYRQSNYVFLLHDTMQCGPRFKDLSLAGAVGRTATMAHPKGFCNLGMYDVEYLHSISSRILQAKNTTKRQAIAMEGKLCKHFSTYPNSTVIRQNDGKPIYTNVSRTIDYYPSVDVYKFGANHLTNLAKGVFVDDP